MEVELLAKTFRYNRKKGPNVDPRSPEQASREVEDPRNGHSFNPLLVQRESMKTVSKRFSGPYG